jgi:hypothetical protein
VAARAQRVGQKSRFDYARGRARRIEPKVSYLVVRVEVPVEGLEIKLGETLVNQAAWGSPLPVDPGNQTLSASAPGFKPWSIGLQIDRAGTRAQIDVPALEVEARPAASIELITPKPPSKPSPLSPTDQPPSPKPGPWRVVSYAVGGIGLIGLGISGGFGLRTLSIRYKRDGNCGDNNECNEAGVAYDRDARSAARISTAAFAAGAALSAVGVTLLVLAPAKPARGPSVALSPDARAHGASLVVRPVWAGLSVAGAF